MNLGFTSCISLGEEGESPISLKIYVFPSAGPILGVSCISRRVAWKNVPLENEKNEPFVLLGNAANYSFRLLYRKNINLERKKSSFSII